MSARDEVLGRIRKALADTGEAGVVPAGDGLAGGETGGYRMRGDLDGDALIDRLVERLRDYGCPVRTCAEGALAELVATALAERGARRIVVPVGLGEIGEVGGVEMVIDQGFGAEELDSFDGVLTTAALAIAETGTIVLDGSAGQGRRALSLVPDYHLCVVRERQVVELVPEAVALLDPQRPLTWISGPSATSDIELDRVQGVHGPRTLEVILVRSSA